MEKNKHWISWCLVPGACTVSWPSWLLSPYEYFKLFVMTEILQTMPFETSRHNLQRFGEDMRVPCTAEEIKKFIGCYFWIGIVMPNQQSFGEKDLSYTGVLSVLSRNRFETLIRTIHVVGNLSVDTKRNEDNRLWKTKPWLRGISPEGVSWRV